MLTSSLLGILALPACKGKETDGTASKEKAATADATGCMCEGKASGTLENRGTKESLKLFCAGSLQTGRGPLRMRDRNYALEAAFRSRLEGSSTGSIDAEVKLTVTADQSIYSSSNCVLAIEENLPLQASDQCASDTMIRVRGRLSCKGPGLQSENGEVTLPDGIQMEFSFDGATL
jgi:hypothetical protein